jgi:hypothetical protein
MAILNGIERRPFDQAIAELLHPEALEHARHHPNESTSYVVWGEYGRILSGYFDVFPREQLLVLFTDELERTPVKLLSRLYEFLGTKSYIPENLNIRYRAGGSQRRFSWLRLGEARRAIAHGPGTRSMWRALPDTIRNPIDRSFDRLVYRADLWNRRPQVNVDKPSSATLSQLQR